MGDYLPVATFVEREVAGCLSFFPALVSWSNRLGKSNLNYDLRHRRVSAKSDSQTSEAPPPDLYSFL